jgi:drug/metabolite transporter superfamily protein YnfA
MPDPLGGEKRVRVIGAVVTERGVLWFLVIATAVIGGGSLVWFLVRVRPRSVALRFAGAALSVFVAVATAMVVIPSNIASRQHAAVDSEGGTFFFGMIAELSILLGALLLLAASLLWRSGIHRHPEPVSRVERLAQQTALVVPLAVYARCAWTFVDSNLRGTLH